MYIIFNSDSSDMLKQVIRIYFFFFSWSVKFTYDKQFLMILRCFHYSFT